MNEVIIVGAGASGLVAAIEAARGNAKVTVIEKNNKVGKKLLATGNGRCNITNQAINTACYRSHNIEFVENILERFSVDRIIDFFENIAVDTKNIGEYIYPASLQASTVVDKLYSECISLGVEFVMECQCKDIIVTKDSKFKLVCEGITRTADKVIVATGLVAGINIKGEKIAVEEVFATTIAKKTGHNIIDIVPGLTGLKCKNPYQDKVNGVRHECKVSTYIDGEKVYEDCGELQFADYGVSGIVVFQNARFAAYGIREKKKTHIVLDMMPSVSEVALEETLINKFSRFERRSLYDILSGMFNNKLVGYILANAKISGDIKAGKFNETNKLVKIIKNLKLEVIGTRGFEYAQVCAGGIDTRYIKDNMESSKVDNLYFTGEALDVDGMCGGYNLHFAFASGIIAGQSVSERR